MSHLVSYYSQIEPNLRRTASKGLISLLNHQQLEDLAFNYFGIKDEYGNITGYQCPYSGKIYTDYQDIVLEHIVPVVSNGGTVLFNCIPTSKEVNGADQKGAKHLIAWWTSSNYWNQDAPLRLEKIVNYMLDGYEQVFKEYTIEEVESSYLDIETDESILNEEDEDINARTEKQLLKQAKNNGIHSYLGFIYDCINTLEKCNINTSSIKERLQQLQEQNIFKDIDKYQLYQNIIQKLVVSRIGDNNSSYLTYTLNFDIKKLMDSINLDNEQDIYNELNRRLQNIEQLLKQNNLSTIEYFKSLKDIQDIDIIYKNIGNISESELQIFLENIKIGLDTKIDIFIEMLSDKEYTGYENGKPNENNIFKQYNKMPFKGYENIEGLSTTNFWNNYSYIIKKRLDMLDFNLKTDDQKEKYRRVRRAIEEYEFQCRDKGFLLRIDCFIGMLSNKQYTSYEDGKPNENNIFKQRNKISFKGYENIKGLYIGNFWNKTSNKIKERLNYLENNSKTNEERTKYQKVRRAIEEYEFTTNLEKRIDCFIEMLSNKQYTSYEDGKPNENNIFTQLNKISFKGYESIDGLNTSSFWNINSSKIKERLKYLENNLKTNEEKEKYQQARRAIEEFEFYSNNEKKIDCFIGMLSNKQYTSYENGKPNKTNIFSSLNKIPFEGYDNIDGINTSQFWIRHSRTIINKLKKIENNLKTNEEKEKYQKVRRAIEEYEFITNLEKRIDCFIDMLSNKRYTSYEDGKTNKNNIFGQRNKIPFNSYENINGLNVSSFWNNHSTKIKERLNCLENNLKTNEEKEKYQKARRAIEEYEFTTDLEKRIDCFIYMLSDKQYTSYENGKPNKKNIFSSLNTNSFKGYESIQGLNASSFWNHNSQKLIIPLLFFNKRYDNKNKIYISSKKNYSTKEYDAARQAVLEYLSIIDKTTYYNIEQYIDKLEQKEKKDAKVLELINLRNNLRKTLELLRIQESKIIDENNQLRNEYIKMHEGIETRRAV